MEPAVVSISSSSGDDDERSLHEEVAVVLISSSPDDDGDDVRNLDQELPESENAGDYNKLDNRESDEEVDNNVKRSDEEEGFDDGHVVDCFNQGFSLVCEVNPDLRTVPPKMIRKKKRGSNDLEELSMYECKTYLRKHGMRVTGTKEECIQRIKEHGRLKDGRGESLYPRSSFSINCTGDACKGDIVFFKQDICKGGEVVGRRSVVGRILKESYGALRQQHTFSVEVLWSKRSKKLNPLSILLVKGRNLYKFGTFRQPWKNEAERSEVLREKHSRGDAARHKWKLRQTEFASSNNRSAKRQKVSHIGPSQTKQPTDIDKHQSTLLAFHPYPSPYPTVNANPDPNPNPNPSSYTYQDHHEQEALSSIPNDRTLLPNQLPLTFPGYGHRNEQQGANQVFNQPPDHHPINYEQPISRLKDGRGESLYPRSSFSINCTGDACKGDIVFFKQDICKGGKLVGRRSVAGRILKESYGASRQQHTFSVEVLWSEWSKKLNPLSILLVKGRNLYRFGTFRQPWKNEAERSEVLREKHSRGDAARHKRKLRLIEFASSNNKSAKRQKVSHREPSQTKQPTDIDKHKSTLLAFHPYPSPDPTVNANPDPNPNPNPSSYTYQDHHEQEALSSIPNDRTLLPNQLPLTFSGYGHRNEQQGANQVSNQPPDHHPINYEQPISRSKGGLKSPFPESSFSINCTGFACKGDVVLFKQDVYNKKNIVGRRSVAGRIIRDCKHRFTIEVLWTKQNVELPPISTLVLKGRELYRFGTFRQPWKNEAERSKVLGKKQRLKGAARCEVKSRKRQIVSNNGEGAKHQQVICRGPSKSKQKFAKRQGAGPVTRSKTAHKRKMKSKKSKQLMLPQNPTPTQIDKQMSDKRLGAAPSAPPHKTEAVWFQNTQFNYTTQPTFHPNPNPNPNLGINTNSDHYPYFNHHLQEASLFNTSLLHNQVSPWLPGYGHYNHGQWGPNNGFYQPPGYCYYNYQQPVPRYWYG